MVSPIGTSRYKLVQDKAVPDFLVWYKTEHANTVFTRLVQDDTRRSSGSSPHWISSDILGDVGIWWDILGDL
jgi:hypothetical protein